ncbi:hypothetical protein GCM10027022_16750 [Alpinimonas psychrophila]
MRVARRVRERAGHPAPRQPESTGEHGGGERGDGRLTLYFLLASAVYRDGLAAVFAFGGILAGAVFGLGDTAIILFAGLLLMLPLRAKFIR